MSRNRIFLCAFLTLTSTFFAVRLPAADGVQLIQGDGKIRIEIQGELFTEYCFSDRLHPWVAPAKGPDNESVLRTNYPQHVYFFPLLGPGGTRMNRNWPMTETAGEERDHPHHRSLWYSHGAVDGVDFWAETPKAGKIVHDRFLEVKGGPKVGVIRSANKWIAPNGEVKLTDERTFRVYARPNRERLFDYEITLQAPAHKDVVLGDTKEGSMAIRVHEEMRLTHGRNKPGKGRIVLSTGVQDAQTWGKRAEWCDYYGPVDGKIVGVAIFDHPGNPKHPTWWHVRDYGLFAANPFGVHDFEKKPAGTGDIRIPAGQSITFRYRFYLHEGDTTQAKVADRYKEYTTAVQ
jgi:hypothetical protein